MEFCFGVRMCRWGGVHTRKPMDYSLLHLSKKISEEHIQNQEEEEKKETGINWVILKSGHKGCLGRWGQLLCNCQALVMPVKIRWIFLSAQTFQVLVFYNYPKMLTLPLAT